MTWNVCLNVFRLDRGSLAWPLDCLYNKKPKKIKIKKIYLWCTNCSESEVGGCFSCSHTCTFIWRRASGRRLWAEKKKIFHPRLGLRACCCYYTLGEFAVHDWVSLSSDYPFNTNRRTTTWARRPQRILWLVACVHPAPRNIGSSFRELTLFRLKNKHMWQQLQPQMLFF